MLGSQLALRFNASPEASLRRLVDLTRDECCLLWLSERLKPKELKEGGPEFDFGFDKPTPELRIDYQFSSSSWSIFLPRHKSIPEESILYSVLNGEAYEAQSEDWSALKLGDVHLEAIGSSHAGPDTRGVMAVLTPSRSISRA
jgi:hypothetical protein